MSELLVQVTTVDTVKAHPNADRLALAVVGGWQCVVGKDQWTAGEKCVFFPPDTILPPEVSDRFGVTQYLSKGRIKHTRLRGEPSFGLVVKPDRHWAVGADVAEHYGATKWEPPKRQGQGDARNRLPDHPKFFKYTDIDNLRHFPTAFQEGEIVVVSEKIHGANCRIGVIDGQIMAGSRRLARPRPTKGGEFATDDGATYWTPLFGYRGVQNYLASFLLPRTWWQRLLRRPQKSSATVILFGEVYGPSIQSFDYGLHGSSLDFRAFDIMVNGNYLDYHAMQDICATFTIPTVPTLYVGPYDLDKITALASGASAVGGTHMREGVVVRPIVERRDARIGRMVLKYVSDDYLLDSKKTDYAEV